MTMILLHGVLLVSNLAIYFFFFVIHVFVFGLLSTYFVWFLLKRIMDVLLITFSSLMTVYIKYHAFSISRPDLNKQITKGTKILFEVVCDPIDINYKFENMFL